MWIRAAIQHSFPFSQPWDHHTCFSAPRHANELSFPVFFYLVDPVLHKLVHRLLPGPVLIVATRELKADILAEFIIHPCMPNAICLWSLQAAGPGMLRWMEAGASGRSCRCGRLPFSCLPFSSPFPGIAFQLTSQREGSMGQLLAAKLQSPKNMRPLSGDFCLTSC